ncbi:MAG: ABC transporter substrate-binding protein, partial [Bacteroidia bacterium]
MKIRTFIAFATVCLFSFNSCKNGSSEIGEDGQNLIVDKPIQSGKVLRLAELTQPMSLFPHKLTHSVEGLISGQIFEGLVKVNPKTLKVEPGLAEKWEVSEDGKKITFFLRKGVKFHPDKSGNTTELSAEDVKYTFNLLCTHSENNLHFATICKDRIVGANEAYEASKKGESIDLQGVKIIDPYTISIELLNSPAIFMDILGSPSAAILSKSAHAKEGIETLAGAGAFRLDPVSSDEKRYVLVKNETYYGVDKSGNKLPILDTISVTIAP